MFGKKRPKVIDRIDTLISAGTEISGDLTFSGGMRIDGIVRGNVKVTGNVDGALVLSQAARVEGEVKVTHAVVNGTILGPLQAKDYVELQSKAKVTGDVSYRTIEVQIGAVALGRLQYLEDPKDDKVLPFKVPTSE